MVYHVYTTPHTLLAPLCLLSCHSFRPPRAHPQTQTGFSAASQHASIIDTERGTYRYRERDVRRSHPCMRTERTRDFSVSSPAYLRGRALSETCHSPQRILISSDLRAYASVITLYASVITQCASVRPKHPAYPCFKRCARMLRL